MSTSSKKYYVNGSIIIETPFFKYENAGCKYPQFSGAEIIPTNQVTEKGEPYLLIDDDHPQSIFGEYYAKDGFSTKHKWAPFFHKKYSDNEQEFNDRIEEARKLVNITQDDEVIKGLLSRQAYLIVVSAFDTFIADTILTAIVHDELKYNSYRDNIVNRTELKTLISEGKNAKAEQFVIDYILLQSYTNSKKITSIFEKAFSIRPTFESDRADKIFRIRHLIAHRGGRRKNGSLISFTSRDLEEVIQCVSCIVKDIMDKVRATDKHT